MRGKSTAHIVPCLRGYAAALLCPVIVLLCVNSARASRREDAVHERIDAVSIRTTEVEISGSFFHWRYSIHNDLEEDIWLCEAVSVVGPDSEVYLAEGGQLLVIRRRLGVPRNSTSGLPLRGSYVRLRSGQVRNESLVLPLPAWQRAVLASPRAFDGSKYIKDISLQIGYRLGDLPSVALSAYEEMERSPESCAHSHRVPLAVYFTILNEQSGSRQERIQIPYRPPGNEASVEVELTLDEQFIECTDLSTRACSVVPLSHPKEYSQAYLECAPSVLEFYFPHACYRRLLNSSEKEYLSNQVISSADNVGIIQGLMSQIHKGIPTSTIAEAGRADMWLFHDGQEPIFLRFHSDRILEVGGRRRFRSVNVLECLRQIPQEIQPFELRFQCADNLEDLWFRLRVYHIARNYAIAKQGRTPTDAIVSGYPAASEWCDAMKWAYETSAALKHDRVTAPYKCPGGSGDMCHYAMNAVAKPNSPGNMVLLFEAKAGWNQYGGPELFTFEHHDPCGGLVLLNDGTVKVTVHGS